MKASRWACREAALPAGQTSLQPDAPATMESCTHSVQRCGQAGASVCVSSGQGGPAESQASVQSARALTWQLGPLPLLMEQ
jgi:hypothetical protein